MLFKVILYNHFKNGALEVKPMSNNHLRWLRVALSDMLSHMNKNGVALRVVATNSHDTFNNGRCAENVHVSHPADGAIFRLPRGLAVPIRHQG